MYFNLLEKRSHPELNPRINAIDVLAKYKDDPNAFITFSTINKLGLNPINEFGTPTGIYAYAVKDVFNSIASGEGVEFAGERPYCILFKAVHPKKILTNKASASRAKTLLDKLRMRIEEFRYQNDNTMIANWNTGSGKAEKPINGMDKVWNLAHNVARYFARKEGKGKNSTWEQNEWSRILMEFGYEGVYDDGKGIIHPNEPAQAVFFRKDFVQLIEVLNNNLRKQTGFEEEGTPEELNRSTYEANKETLFAIRTILEESGKLEDGMCIGASKMNLNLKVDLSHRISKIVIRDRPKGTMISHLSFNKINYKANKPINFSDCSITAKKGTVSFENCILTDTILDNPKNSVEFNKCHFKLYDTYITALKNTLFDYCIIDAAFMIGSNHVSNVNGCTLESCVMLCKSLEDLKNVKIFLDNNKVKHCYVYFGKYNQMFDSNYETYHPVSKTGTIKWEKLDFGTEGKIGGLIASNPKFFNELYSLMNEILYDDKLALQNMYFAWDCYQELDGI